MNQSPLTHPHRLKAIVSSLKYQRNALLDVANTLNDKFNDLALQYKIPVNIVWDLCYIVRYGFESQNYHEQSSEIESILGNQYEVVEDAVLAVLDNTHRCSSIVENFHSRLRPYIGEAKARSQKLLDLIRFYLNHKPFLRSTHAALRDKTAAEALTGHEHLPWLEMLGFKLLDPVAA